MEKIKSGQSKRYFEDLNIGDISRTASYQIGEAEIISFAKEYDPLPIHIDHEAAAASRFGTLIASGLHTLALWRKLDYPIVSDIASICGLGMDQLVFANPLFPGDTMHCTSRIHDKQIEKADSKAGIISFDNRIYNQDEQLIASHITRNLVSRRT